MNLSTYRPDRILLLKIFHTCPLEPRYLTIAGLKNPRAALLDNDEPGKTGGHMHMPPPGVARNAGLHFDRTFDQPGWDIGLLTAISSIVQEK
jgi:hypothetical protein